MSKELIIQQASDFKADAGAWQEVPMSVYHAAEGESNSSLALLEESPARYKMHKAGKRMCEETRDMQIGTVIHALVSGDSAPYHIKPETCADGKKWNGNAAECKAWISSHSDMPIFDNETALMIEGVRTCFAKHSKFQRLISGAYHEVSACAYNDDLQLTGLLRVRFDIIGKDENGWYFADIKSMRDASTDQMQREIFKRQYYVQFALYRRVLRILTGKTPRAYIAGVEKSKTHPRVNVRQMSHSAMDAGDCVINDRLRLLKRCKLANHWPDFADDEGGENIQFIDLPEWCNAGMDTLTGMTEVNNEGENES